MNNFIYLVINLAQKLMFFHFGGDQYGTIL